MTTAERSLRFELDDYFRAVEAECAKVRASEIVRNNAAAGERPQPLEDERFPSALELVNDRAFLDRYPDGVDLVQVRQKVRERLRDLKSSIGRAFRPHVTYEILYPITVHTDELLLNVAGSRAQQWELLQSELFDMDYGGDEFYERLEARLSDDDTRSFVFEAYYYCLSDGFGGRHRGNKARRDEYRMLLANRIDIEEPERRAKTEVASNPIQPRKPTWPLYLAATGAVVVFWLVLGWFAQIGNAQ